MTDSPDIIELLRQQWTKYRVPYDIRSVPNAVAVFGDHAIADQSVLRVFAHELHELHLDTGSVPNSFQIPSQLAQAIAAAEPLSDDLRWLAGLVLRAGHPDREK
jgi:hypothetical protein